MRNRTIVRLVVSSVMALASALAVCGVSAGFRDAASAPCRWGRHAEAVCTRPTRQAPPEVADADGGQVGKLTREIGGQVG